MWELYEKMAGNWFKVCNALNGYRCQITAKQMVMATMRPGRMGSAPYREFAVRDPSGHDWSKTVKTGSWSIQWEQCQ